MQENQNTPDRTLDFEGFPGLWEIRKTSQEMNGERFETLMKVEEQGELPPHTHPQAQESYQVVSGALDVRVDGEWSTLETGEKHTVPPGTPHTFEVKGPVEMINVHQPAMGYEEYFRRFHKLKTEHGVEMPPRGLKSMILLGMLQMEYEEEFISTMPPQWVFRLLAGLGNLLGITLPV